MDLQRLHVLHLPKTRARVESAYFMKGLASLESAFYLETCQRWLLASCSSTPLREVHPALSKNSEIELYQGKEAYLFLLRLASGLESEILGETDVFGQVKEAWRKAEGSDKPWVDPLGPWMRRIFEDTKEIRTRYLQNLGGTSYGTLVRKLIRDQNQTLPLPQTQPQIGGPTFLVGAGQIAHSIAPFLLDSNLWIWNRTPDRLTRLHQSLSARSRPPKTGEITVLEDESSGWLKASTIVICTPFDPLSDSQRVAWLSQREQKDYTVIHLGGLKEHAGIWQSVPRFFCLDDIFFLQSSLKTVRSAQIAQAARACEERADLRAMNISLPMSHQWDTLATFA